MDALLMAIVTWLSANTDLPANYQLPTTVRDADRNYVPSLCRV